MAKIENEILLNVYMNEYSKLKDEQRNRIGFRDNLIYATLIAIGGILSYATADPSNYNAFLVLPILSFVLGWTYLLNDEKITSIGQYVQKNLSVYINNLFDANDATVFSWENVHREERSRIVRKLLQLLANELLFCASGLSSVLFFFYLSTTVSSTMRVIGIVEIIMSIIIGIEIIMYSDIRKSTESYA